MADNELRLVLRRLQRLANPAVARRAERFGVKSANVLGISAPELRALAKAIGTNQKLSLALWPTGFLEARVLAALIGDPALVSKRQMEQWVRNLLSFA